MNKLSVFAGAAALALLVGPAAADDANKAPGASGMQATAGEVAKNPEKFYGKKVQITAEVEDTYSPHAFTLDEDTAFAGPDVLVLNPAPRRESKDDEDVTVHGIVRQFSRAEMERDYKRFDFKWLESDQSRTDFTTRPVIVADSIKTAGGEELVRAGGSSLSAGDQPIELDKKMLDPKGHKDMKDASDLEGGTVR